MYGFLIGEGGQKDLGIIVVKMRIQDMTDLSAPYMPTVPMT
jgi:hypothetical protein